MKFIGDAMMSHVFLKEKPVRALVALADNKKVWYANALCKEIDCTYPHMINTLNTFERIGLIKTEGQGRIRVISLTELGHDIAHDFEGVVHRLDKFNEKPDDGNAAVNERQKIETAKEERRQQKKQKPAAAGTESSAGSKKEGTKQFSQSPESLGESAEEGGE
jgi:DNA-binding MarR family transcriptional regulator